MVKYQQIIFKKRHLIHLIRNQAQVNNNRLNNNPSICLLDAVLATYYCRALISEPFRSFSLAAVDWPANTEGVEWKRRRHCPRHCRRVLSFRLFACGRARKTHKQTTAINSTKVFYQAIRLRWGGHCWDMIRRLDNYLATYLCASLKYLNSISMTSDESSSSALGQWVKLVFVRKRPYLVYIFKYSSVMIWRHSGLEEKRRCRCVHEEEIWLVAQLNIVNI